jgi:hypothetical protein
MPILNRRVQVGKELKMLCPKRKKKRSGKKYDRQNEYLFPNLIEYRKEFEKLVDIELDWEE